mmetsp:Transcript_28974/g.92841  ORF Transcript_28974/g.92841 Transcript_28974/m.92841 type:complete len:229 (+) Transcript_28974:885-1571(+)
MGAALCRLAAWCRSDDPRQAQPLRRPAARLLLCPLGRRDSRLEAARPDALLGRALLRRLDPRELLGELRTVVGPHRENNKLGDAAARLKDEAAALLQHHLDLRLFERLDPSQVWTDTVVCGLSRLHLEADRARVRVAQHQTGPPRRRRRGRKAQLGRMHHQPGPALLCAALLAGVKGPTRRCAANRDAKRAGRARHRQHGKALGQRLRKSQERDAALARDASDSLHAR